MKKRFLSLLLVLVMVLSLLPGVAQAASSEEEALGEVNIFNGGTKLSYLAINGKVQSFLYTYFKYQSANGTVKEIPAYCVNPTVKGVPQTVAPGESIKYLADQKASDPKITGIVANGYPTRGLGELKLENKEQAYYATKMALWCYILPGWNINNLKVNSSLTGVELQRAQKILAAAKDIYTRGTRWTTNLAPSLTTEVDREEAYPVTINGVSYKQQVITVKSATWICNYAVQVAFSDPSAVPAGTKIVDMDNNEISTITTTTDGGVYAGKCKILYPADSVAGKSGSVQLTFSANVYQYAVFYASCMETNKYGQLQHYMCDTDPTRTMSVSAVSTYGDGQKVDQPETGLEIVKVEAGTNIPLEGAVFEVKLPSGDVYGTYSTDAQGHILLDLRESGTYVVTELIPPKYYLPAETPTQTVTVRYGETAKVTFANEPYGDLRIEKVDAANGDGLYGAQVQIRHIETGATQTGTTNMAGVCQFTNLRPGAYEIREITAPIGYQLDSQIHTVNVVKAAVTSYTLKNEANPGLRIVKYDRGSMETLPDVSFNIYKDTVLLGTYQTDQLGEILLTDLEPGTYRVEEVDTGDESHIVNVMPQEIELEAGDGILQLVFFNDRKPGLRMVKVDSADPSKVLPNAVFEIKSVDGSFGPKEFTTNEYGEIDLSNLPAGAYVVTEKSCPGYEIDDAQRIIQLRPNETGEFVFTNSIKPSLQIIKTSTDGTPLPGVTFRIAKIADGSHYLDRTTDAQGVIRLDGLEPGVYSVKETATVSDHILDTKEYHVELFAGKVSTLVIQNERRPNLTVYKHDADTGEPVPNTAFLVKAADGHSVDEIRTGEDGSARLENLLPGVYEIIEKSVPSPYLLDASSQLVTLYPNRDHTVFFENHQKPVLTIRKIDSITKEPIPNTKFQIWYLSNNTDAGEMRDLGYYYTDEDGQIQLSKLADGWYRVTEVEPTDGYAMKDPTTQQFYLTAGTGKTITFENTPLSGLVIRKVDADTGAVLQGAKFSLKYLSGTSGTGGTTIGEYTTGANGTVTINRLKAGTYVVEEVHAPDGYEISEGAKTVYITGNEQAVVTVEFADKAHGQLIVRKLDSVTKQPLPGAIFEITTSDGAYVPDAGGAISSNGVYTTDENGQIHITGVAPGTTLVVTETKAPDGYVLDTTSQTVVINANDTQTLTFTNTPIGGLTIIKTDEESGKRIPGVQLEVRRMNGEIIGTYTTGENGLIRLPEAETGWYTVTELKAAKGYRLDATPKNIEVKDGQTAVLTVTNHKASGVLIHKVDANTGEGIYGTTFLLYDANHNPVGEYVSDQDGYVYMDEGLEDGRYYLREIRAADGYIRDDTLKTIYVRYGATSEIRWENTAIKGQIQIIKKSADDNPINGLSAGTLLEGAVFEIYDKAGNTVDTIRTDKNGRAVSKLLPLSRYTIREIKAPNYYAVNTTVMTAYLEHEGQIVTFEVENSSVTTGVSIKKTGYAQVMPGQPIRYTLTQIGNTSTVPLESFYWRDTLPAQVRLDKIITGTYNQNLSYKVIYKTNTSNGYLTLADNLSTAKNYVLDTRPAALGLASNERITELMFVFGTVKAGFAQVETPYLYGTVSKGLSNGSSFVNVADVGGLYQGQWIMGVSRWVTEVYAKTNVTLPKTGY